MPSRKNEIKIEQYRRCAEDIRHFDRVLWQAASIAITLSGVMAGVAFGHLSGLPRTAIMLVASLFLVAMTIVIAKYCLFNQGRAEFAKQIEKNFRVKKVPVGTDEILKFMKKKTKKKPKIKIKRPLSWFKHQRAHRWLIYIMLLITGLFFALTLWTFHSLYNTITTAIVVGCIIIGALILQIIMEK